MSNRGSGPRVAVVGGGIMGMMCAYYVSELRGAHVTVYERDHVAAGSTSASGANVGLQTKSSADLAEVTLASMALYDALASDHAIAYRRHGSLMLCRTAEELASIEGRAAWLNSLGVRCHVLGRDDTRMRLPLVAPDIVGAGHAPDDAEALPAPIARQLAEILAAREVVLEIGVAVREVLVTDGAATGVRTDAGVTRYDAVVLAPGAGLPELLRPLGLELPLTFQVGEQLVTVPTEHRVVGRVLSASYLETKHVKTDEKYFVAGLAAGPEAGGGIRIGSTRQSPERGLEPSVRARDALLDLARTFLPPVADLEIAHHSIGYRLVSGSGRPMVGPLPQVGNLYVVTGHGGDGVTLAPLSGQVVADHIAGRRSAYRDRFTVDRSDDTQWTSPGEN